MDTNPFQKTNVILGAFLTALIYFATKDQYDYAVLLTWGVCSYIVGEKALAAVKNIWTG